MKPLQAKARRLFERYLHGVRRALAGNPAVDRRDVERDIRDHVERALDEADEPVSPKAMAGILARLGRPASWLEVAAEQRLVNAPRP